MADIRKALAANVDGDLFVDSTCINCGVSRHYAPEVFGDTGEFAFVRRQPQTANERLAALQGMLSCPVGSIGSKSKEGLREAMDALPKELVPGIFINGFNHRDSYGAHSYFIRDAGGNWLIDSPRFIPHLVKKFEAMGGIGHVFLTHRDDVADAHLYARHFGAPRIIHRHDADAQKDAELILEEERDYRFGRAQILYTPGHTKGHMVLLWQERCLFTGDHFAWLPGLGRFGSFRDFCWHSWEQQIASVERLAALSRVEWVFPGHGRWKEVSAGGFSSVVAEAVRRMKAPGDG